MNKQRSLQDLTKGLKIAANSVATLADEGVLTEIQIRRIKDIEGHLLDLEYCLSQKKVDTK